MSYLVDTSVLVRLANQQDASYGIAWGAVTELHRRGEVLHIASQNLVEFLNVATRPLANNGLGLSPADAHKQLVQFESTFPLLAETVDIHPAWKTLVSVLGVIGKQVHDARLVAICRVHGVSQVLTFNTAHFARLGTAGPTITAVHPHDIQPAP
ncbi:MAG: type II toxin-antitoxin system VapC family toxin [Pirellulaceae bacterium]